MRKEKDMAKNKFELDINTSEWQTYTFKQKIAYFKKLMIYNKGDIADSIFERIDDVLNTIRNGTDEGSPTRKYIDLACVGIKSSKLINELSNKFTKKIVKVTTNYDYIYKYIKCERQDLFVDDRSINNDIIRLFVENIEQLAAKGVFRIDKVEYDKKTPDSNTTSVKFMVTWGENPFGINNLKFFIDCHYSIQNEQSAKTIPSTGTFIIAYDMSTVEDYDFNSFDDVSQLVLRTALSTYVGKLDTKTHYIKLEPYGNMRMTKLKHINFDINNFDMCSMEKTIRKCLNKNRHRGYMFMGDPGTGKTVSIFKLLEKFNDVPVFWVDSSMLQSSGAIRDVYKTLHYFPNSICVFDDIDAVDLSYKSPQTTAFIECMDNKDDAMSYSGITIMTVNEPSRIHSSIKTRSERIDQIIYIKNPGTLEKVYDIIKQRYVNANLEVPDIFRIENKKLHSAVQKCIANNFTHAHIASIIDDIITLNDDLDEDGIIDEFVALIDARIDSLKYASMKTKDGYFEKYTETNTQSSVSK